MYNIILNGKVLSFDTVIYIDNTIGNDTTGNGTTSKPYLTLAKAHQFHSGNTAYVLGDGVYDSVNLNNTKYNNSSITYIGKGLNTTFRLTGTLTSTNTSMNLVGCKIYFYKLIFDGNNLGSGANNFILYSNLIEFNNIVFVKIASDNYGYFCSVTTSAKLVMNNCIKPANSSNFIRSDSGPSAELNYCYGAFTAGYGSSLATMNKIDNVITPTPQLDASYNITESLSVNIGVYNGLYKWTNVKAIVTILDSNIIISTPSKISIKINNIISDITLNLNNFKIFLNGTDILYDGSITNSFPKIIDINIPNISELVNVISINIDGIDVWFDIIYYEGDGLLNPIVRDFKITDWVDKSNVAINPGTGISLTNQNRQGSVFTDISVYKKAEVKKVTVDGDNDKVITGNFVFKPNFVDTYFYKNVITRPFGSKFTKMTYLINYNLLYMKTPIENAAYTNITDNNDVTSNLFIGSSPLTWNFDRPSYIKAIYINGGTIKLYNSSNILVKTINANGISLVDLNDIVKLVATSRSGNNEWIYTISVYGYDEKQLHLYSNPKYNIYSPINVSVSKLVLEDSTTITKDLVKSKKMGNLAFINNPSKVVVKKNSSISNQTSSKIVRNKMDLTNIPMRKIEVK